MAKLTRRQRKELECNPKKQQKKIVSESVMRESRTLRKKHICIFHKYQEQQDGTYVCQICGHYFEKKMGEDELRKYFFYKNDYFLNELKGMDCRLLRVTYSKNTRGSVTEHQVEVLAGIQAIETVCKEWRYFGCVTNDLKFEEDWLLYVDFIHQDINRGCPEEHWWYPSMRQLEAFFERENEEYISVEDFWNTQQQWDYRTSDGKVHWYGVYPVLKGRMVDFPGMYYLDADAVAARKYVFSENGELEKVVVCLWDRKIYSLSK